MKYLLPVSLAVNAILFASVLTSIVILSRPQRFTYRDIHPANISGTLTIKTDNSTGVEYVARVNNGYVFWDDTMNPTKGPTPLIGRGDP